MPDLELIAATLAGAILQSRTAIAIAQGKYDQSGPSSSPNDVPDAIRLYQTVLEKLKAPNTNASGIRPCRNGAASFEPPEAPPPHPSTWGATPPLSSARRVAAAADAPSAAEPAD